MKADRAIYAPQVFLPEGIQAACLYIKDGKIAGIQDSMPQSCPFPIDIIDQGLLMPGFVDVHAHINEPGRTEWEGFHTATRAAAAGGITTMMDMPLNSEPVTTNVKAFDEKKAAAKKNLHINVGFWGGLIPDNTNDLAKLLESGIYGLKAFLVHSGIDSFPNVTVHDLEKAMPLLQKAGLPLLVHCELPVESANTTALIQQPDSYSCWLASRPDEMELKAIELMIRLCEKYNCRTHIVHLTSAKAIPLIKSAINRGLPLTVETCPHYLFFNEENIPNGQCSFKCAPPIRDKANNTALLKALCEGDLNFIASDHSPAPPAIKKIASGNLLEAWGGIASNQLLLPVMWTLLRHQKQALDLLVGMTIEQPLQFLGMSHRKGKLAIGYDADFVVWNPETSFSVKEEELYFRHPSTCPYVGEKLFGKVEKTYVNGQLVFDDPHFKQLNAGQLLLADLV